VLVFMPIWDKQNVQGNETYLFALFLVHFGRTTRFDVIDRQCNHARVTENWTSSTLNLLIIHNDTV